MNRTAKDKKIKKPVFIIVGVVLVWISVIAFISTNYVFAGGKLINKKTESLDLSGRNIRAASLTKLPALKDLVILGSDVSVSDYKSLTEELPDCHIRWSVPLSAGKYDNESEEISISSISEEDIELFDLFGNLKIIRAEGIPEWKLLAELENRYPAIKVDWSVDIGEKYYSADTSELDLNKGTDLAELLDKLRAFKGLNKVSVDGNNMAVDDQLALVKEYPYLKFDWLVNVTPEGFSSLSKKMDFNGKQGIDLDLLVKCAPLFYDLETIDFSGCNYSNHEMKKVADAYPEAEVLWQFAIYGQQISSLDEEIDFSGMKIEDTSEIEDALPYLKKLNKVIMSDCGISDEDMDALNRRHENVKFVWTVYFGSGYHLRTDETVFIASLFYGGPETGRNDLRDNNIQPLKYCTDMIAIDIGHQHISDCTIFSGMKDLKWLIIAMTNITDISPLANCKELFYLEMFLCQVTDLSPLLECKNLRHLDICQCPTSGSLDVLAQMTWLERCWMSGGFTYDDNADRAYVYSDEFLPHTMKRLRGLDHTGDGWRNYPTYFEMRDIFNAPHYPTWWSSNEWRNNPNVIVPEGFIEEHGLDESNDD